MIHAIHGNLGHPSEWNQVQESFGPGFEWNCPNLWEDPVAPFAAWADRFNDQAEALDPCPILLGYSLGGRLAMHALASATPPLWEAAIFVSAHPGFPPNSENDRHLRSQRDTTWASTLRQDGAVKFLRDWNAQEVLRGQPISSRQVATVAKHPDSIAQAFEVWSLGLQADLRQQLLDSGVPQLWVVGAEDAKFRAIAEEAVAAIPSATLDVIEGCGHRVPLQKPRELAESICRFLTALKLKT
ncbi:MAG: 2-succinyl-6-hydroxy-2,4-cyclohexadiene-1-carboxylate synthase [Verrucomicrobiales bacterium]|jgi:2-succinyl-6-hydroxy-2,4-cyclohexadiene-1-carboxylate synthase